MMTSNGSGESVRVIVGRLCHETVRATSVDGGSVALVSTEASRAVLSVTDPLAMALEEAQMALGEGPYVDAVHSLSPMMVSDLREPGTAAARWPFFAKEAKSLDVCALFAFPLTVSTVSVGSIGLYRRQAGNLNTQHLGMALNAAHDISRALVDQATWADVPRKSASNGHGRLTLRTAQIHQAAGMV